MGIKVYQVDAFASELFRGNPAAVCVLDSWPEDALMQSMAMEHNLAETAFVVGDRDRFLIRWFTPEVEVDLCGHATLASAHVLFHHLDYPGELIRFHSPHSGELRVGRNGALLTLDFPADRLEEIPLPEACGEALGRWPEKAYRGKDDFMLVFPREEEVQGIRPDMRLLAALGGRGVIVTAPGREADFVSRFFAPQSGISEDPVTGSAHTTLTPYWSSVLGKKKLRARQLSARGGELLVEDCGERVKISGKAVTYMVGELYGINKDK